MLTKFTPFTFETAVPESVGIDSTAIAEFEAAIRQRKSAHQGYMIYQGWKARRFLHRVALPLD